MIEVYYASGSIYGRKVLTVLEEKGLDYQIKKLSFETKDHLKEDYLKLNPNGEIPTLVDDGQVIYESTAICEYLNDEYPYPPLLPDGSYDRARVRMIEDFFDLHVYKHLVRCYIKKHIKKEELTDADFDPIKNDLLRLEQYLGKQDYFAGSQLTLADCAYMPALASIEAAGLGKFLDAVPTLKKYSERLKLLKSYSKGANLLTV